MYREEYLSLNNGDSILINSTSPYSALGGTMYAYDEGDSMPLSISDTSSACRFAMSKSLLDTAFFNNFLAWRTDAELASDEFLTLRNYFIDNTVWIWGSVDLGGCFYYNGGTGGKCSLGACYGFTKNNEEKKHYQIVTAVDGFTPSEAASVAFSWDGQMLSLDLEPSLQIWYINDGYKDGTITDDLPVYGDWSSDDQAWIYNTTTDLSELLKIPLWEPRAISNPSTVPSRIWYTVQRATDKILKSLNATVQSSIVLYGDITGDAKVDPEVNPAIKGGTTEPDGGQGDYPDRSDNVDFSDPEEDIDVDAVSSGFITLYNPTKQQVKDFSDFLWTDITDALSQQIKKIIANPLDAVLFVAMCHFNPPTTGVSQIIKYCGISTNVGALLINKQYFTLDCGSITVQEATSSFLDYNPYSKANIYLPYVGINSIDINDIMGSTVSIKYHIDLISGSALAQVKCERAKRREGDAQLSAVLYEFPCNVYEQLPLSATDWRAAISNMISLVSGGAAVATGNGAGLGAMASAVASQQVSVVRSGSISGNYGYIGKQKPYLILERPINNLPANFPMYEGFTSNIQYRLGNLSGYTEVDADSWKSERILGTEDEMKEIKDLLNTGVFL